MFTKSKKVGSGQYGVYKRVIDWDAIIAWLVVGGIAVLLLSTCAA